MFKYLVLMTILSLTVVATPQAFSETGFHKANDPSIPEKIREAANSVYQIRTAPASHENSITLDLTIPSTKNVVLNIFKSLREQGFDELDAQIVNLQIQFCVQNKMEKECEVNLKINRGTGFLVTAQNKQFLMTNAHIAEQIYHSTLEYIEDWKDDPSGKLVSQKLKEGMLRSDSFYVFDQNRKLIYNSRLKDQQVYISLPEITIGAIFQNSFYAPDSDLVFVKLKRKIGASLNTAKKAALPNEEVYIVGYPSCTNCRAEPPVTEVEAKDRGMLLNSDGKSQYVSSGKILNRQEADEFFDLTSTQESKIFNLNRMIFSSADAMHGSSGSPMLNSSGEVVGILSGSTHKLINGNVVRRTRGVLLNLP